LKTYPEMSSRKTLLLRFKSQIIKSKMSNLRTSIKSSKKISEGTIMSQNKTKDKTRKFKMFRQDLKKLRKDQG